MRRMFLGLSFICGHVVGATGAAPAESPDAAIGEASRPVVLIDHEIHGTSPFAADSSAPLDIPVRLPAVPTTRWQPESRLEPAVRVDRSVVRPADDGWRTVSAPTTTPAATTPTAPTTTVARPTYPTSTAAPGTTLNTPRPIAASVPSSVPALASPASGPWSPPGVEHPYAIGGVQPQVAVARPPFHYVAKNVWGEPKNFVAGQHVRNAFRYLVP